MNRTRRTVTGLGLIVGGALLGMLALTVLSWFRSTFGGILTNGSAPTALRSTLTYYADREDRVGGYFEVGVAKYYFAWLALVVLALAVLAAIVGLGSDAGSPPARIGAAVSAVAALAGIVLTGFAVQLVDFDPLRAPAVGIRADVPDYGDYLSGTGLGTWTMVLGFLLVGVGAVLASGGRDAMRDLLDGDPEPDEELPAQPVEPAPEPPRRRGEDW